MAHFLLSVCSANTVAASDETISDGATLKGHVNTFSKSSSALLNQYHFWTRWEFILPCTALLSSGQKNDAIPINRQCESTATIVQFNSSDLFELRSVHPQ